MAIAAPNSRTSIAYQVAGEDRHPEVNWAGGLACAGRPAGQGYRRMDYPPASTWKAAASERPARPRKRLQAAEAMELRGGLRTAVGRPPCSTRSDYCARPAN